MNDKERKGQYLLGEFNYIDDDLLYEATTLYPAARKKSKHNRIIALICAAVAATMLLAPISTAGAIFFTISEFIGIGNDKHDAANPPTSEETVRLLSPNEVTSDLFFSQSPLIIWQEQNSESLYVMPIEKSDLLTIEALAEDSVRISDDAPTLEKRIWICDGNGLVTTPYLEDAPGNRYNATLFDYDPELVLSDELDGYLAYLTS